MSTIYNYDSNTVISGTADNDYIFNGDAISKVTIEANEGNDVISNHGGEVIIYAGDGNDSIYTDIFSMAYEHATVFGGNGEDTIKIRDNRSLLVGDDDNDVISVYSGAWLENTLQGGKGNDTIYGGGSNVFVYAEGDGNDIWHNVNNGDKIQIFSNKSYITVEDNNDLVIYVNTASITLKNAKGKNLDIVTVSPNSSSSFNSVINEINDMDDSEFNNFIETLQKVSHGLSELAEIEAAGWVDDSIEYFKNLRKLFFNTESKNSDKVNLLKLSSSSISEFATIHGILNKVGKGTNSAIWGAAAEKNIKVLTVASDLLSIRASFVKAGKSATRL